MIEAIRRFPARPLTPKEKAVVAEWLAAAGDIALAYVSGRQDDDPLLRNRIVVLTEADGPPAHLIHAPLGRNIWMVFSRGGGKATRIRRYRNLRGALNAIRPVLVETRATDLPDAARQV